MEENFEESVTYVDSQKLKVDDPLMKENGSVMKSVQFGDEFSVGSGIVQIAKVQNTEVIVEENGSNNNEDIVSESLIDGEIINEIKKINDKLRCGGGIELEGSSDTEENQNIKRRHKRNSLMYTVSGWQDVVMSSGIVDYGCISDEETCPNISRQKGRSEVCSMGVQVKKQWRITRKCYLWSKTVCGNVSAK